MRSGFIDAIAVAKLIGVGCGDFLLAMLGWGEVFSSPLKKLGFFLLHLSGFFTSNILVSLDLNIA